MVRIGVAIGALLLAGCGGGGNSAGDAASNANATAAVDRACASEETYDRLKELALDEAARIRGDRAEALDRIADSVVVRMENPVVRARDEELNVTTCAGRFVLELPPGSENAFDGERRLSADVEYAAQTAADGSGLVYQMEGAEPIIYKLATIGGLARAENRPPTIPSPGAPPAAPQAPPAPTEGRAASPPAREKTAPAEQPEARAAAERPASARPSFNCRYARSRSEQMVCTDGSLAALDRRMASRFYSALAQADPQTRAALRRSRDRFLTFRERCGDAACIAQAYRDRMDEIEDMAAGR